MRPPETGETTVELGRSAPGAEQARVFRPGERVAGRYAVVRFVSEGGMGEVYEAIDEELKERIALKTVRPEIAADEGVQLAFKRETHLARRVTHRNVCRIFDLGFAGKTMFLTMEYLAGETLADRLGRLSRLSAADALPIVRQIAAGLDAAHRAGVIHGDLKPGNVMLVPSGDGERAVVGDFGLAGWGLPPAHVLAGGEALRGSPAYLASEVLDGPASAAADIFSFGVLLYRMVGGALPFAGDSAAAIRRRARPASPRVHAPALPVAWERAILRCLEPRPTDRFARAEDVVRAVEDGRRMRRRWGLAGAAAIAVVATVSWSAARPAARGPGHEVAVVGLRNLTGSGDLAWVATGLGELLGSELAAGDLPRVAYALAGTYAADGGGLYAGLHVELSLHDAASAATVAEVSVDGRVTELGDLAARAARALRARLGLPSLTAAQRAEIAAVLPRSSEAARAYAGGLSLARRFEYAAASAMLERAAALEPGFSRTHAALADAYWFLGRADDARDAARRALDVAHKGSAPEQMVAEARFWEASGEPRKAVAVLERLHRAHPDNVEHAFALIFASLRAGDGAAARELTSELRRRSAPVGDDLRLDVAELRLAADSPALEPIAARLVSAARAQAALPFLIEGLGGLANARWRRGELGAALALQRELRAVAGALGDRNAEAGSRFLAALVLVDGGRLDEARAELGAPPAAESAGRGELANHLHVEAAIALERGDGVAARHKLADEQRALLAATRHAGVVRQALGLARVALAGGDLDAAEKHATAARQQAQELGSPTEVAYSLTVLADVALGRGQVALAEEGYRDAQRVWRARAVPLEVARLDVALSRAALVDDRAAEAEALARAAEETAARLALPDDRARAAAALSEALAAQGKMLAALGALTPVLASEEHSERLAVRRTVERARQRVAGVTTSFRSQGHEPPRTE